MLINRICVALAAISILCVASAAADPYCSPGSNSARILTKPAPNALHPDWRGDNFVGTGWTLIPKKIVSNITGRYAYGDLHGSRGGVVNRNIYVLLSEWDCTGVPGSASDTTTATAAAPANLAGFEGTWERLGTQCEASHTHAKGQYFTIAGSTFAPGDGAKCENISLTRYGKDIVEVSGTCRTAEQGPPSAINHRYKLRNGLIDQIAGAAVLARYEKCDVAASDETPPALPCEDGAHARADITSIMLYRPLLEIRHDNVEALARSSENASWNMVKCDDAHRVASIQKVVFGKPTTTTTLEYVDNGSFVKKLVVTSADAAVLTTAFVTRDGDNRVVNVESKGANSQSANAVTFTYDGEKQIGQALDGSTGLVTARWERWLYPDGAVRIWKVIYPAYWYEYQYGSGTGTMLVRYKGDKDGAFWKTTFQHDQWRNLVGEGSIPLKDTSDTVSKTGAYFKGDLVKEFAVMKNGEKHEWQNVYDDQHSYTESQLSVNGRYIAKFVVTRNGSALQGTTAYAPDGHKLVYYPGLAMRYINRDGSPVDGGAFEKSAKGMLW
jgi:hypothetical protein